MSDETIPRQRVVEEVRKVMYRRFTDDYPLFQHPDGGCESPEFQHGFKAGWWLASNVIQEYLELHEVFDDCPCDDDVVAESGHECVEADVDSIEW